MKKLFFLFLAVTFFVACGGEDTTKQLEAKYKEINDAHDEAMSAHERAMETHQKNMESHRKNIENHNKQVAAHEKTAKRNNQTSDAFTKQLWKDGLISSKENFSFSLSLKKFKIDGEVQNKNIRDKYIRLYEELMGKAMNSKSTYSVSHNSN